MKILKINSIISFTIFATLLIIPLGSEHFLMFFISPPNFLIMNKKPAPLFELPGTDGNTHKLEDLKGKPVFLNFWSITCNLCLAEMNSLNNLNERIKDKITIIGINIDNLENKNNVLRIIKKKNIKFLNLFDEKYLVASKYKVYGIPLAYLISDNGEIIGKYEGIAKWDSEDTERLLLNLTETK